MKRQVKTKFVVVAGGVISGVGKGVATASIGKIFKEHGLRTTLIKIDPYINYDAGTLRPTEHGEVWVTGDGGEIDQDLGTYERFIDQDIPKKNNITTGQIYKHVIDRERAGGYLGQTVQFIPHLTDEIIARLLDSSEGYDVAVIEIGGTVGDYENVPFLMALKGLEREIEPHQVAYVLVTYLPVPGHIEEMKTKPTQQAIRMLGEQGIMPDFIICRSQKALDDVRRKKIESFAHIPLENIIAAPDLASVYEMPLVFEQQQLGKKLLEHLQLAIKKEPDWRTWQQRVACAIKPSSRVKIGIVGKYLDIGDYSLSDSYLSICHALKHAGAYHDVATEIVWIDAKTFEKDPKKVDQLAQYQGIVVPGGFGPTGVEGKILAIEYARKHNVPFLGLCYGMQLAAVEYARNVCGLKDAHTTEVCQDTPHPIIDVLPMQKQLLEDHQYGGTMRLGSYAATIREGTLIHRLYRDAGKMLDGNVVIERHRHRYEVNPLYIDELEQQGFLFSGKHKRIDGTMLMEFAEIANHPFFAGTQAHPEFTSRFAKPNPMFSGFVAAAMKFGQSVVFTSKKKSSSKNLQI